MKTVIATVNLADPKGGGPDLPHGVPVSVDDSDSEIKSLLDAGYLVPVDAQGNVQEWTPGEAGVQIGAAEASDLSTTGGAVQPKAKK